MDQEFLKIFFLFSIYIILCMCTMYPYFLNDSVENFSKPRIIDLYNRTEHDAVIKGQIHQYDSTSEVF